MTTTSTSTSTSSERDGLAGLIQWSPVHEPDRDFWRARRDGYVLGTVRKQGHLWQATAFPPSASSNGVFLGFLDEWYDAAQAVQSFWENYDATSDRVGEVAGLLVPSNHAQPEQDQQPHEPDQDGLAMARAVAGWELGDPSWADKIIDAYLNPERTRDALAAEQQWETS